MDFRDKEGSIYYRLIAEYGRTDASIRNWNDFILFKDLGIILLSWQRQEYKIINEKKWALAKIKYAI
jgi:hypothetical protein